MMTQKESIPEELRIQEQWVCARDDSKVPMRAWELRAASSSDPSTWADFETAIEATYYDWVGYVFADNGYVGIDIDCGFDDDGFISPLGAEIIGMCHSYTEVSKSGRGFHIILKGNLPFDGANNRKGVEIYKSKRYFILTGNTILFESISENQSAIDYVVSKFFESESIQQDHSSGNARRIYSPIWRQVTNGKTIRLRPEYPKIAMGGRNVSMLSLAAQLRNVGYNADQLLCELQKVNKDACIPPLSDDELCRICKSVMRYSR